MSSDEELNEDENNKMLAFVSMLEDYKIIMEKRMTPAIKTAKQEVLLDLTGNYNKNTKQNLTEKQIQKKVHNLKTRIK